ncbi:MAG: 50S ribosomal protein L25/general stress protein Ctc [Actinomycetota bacterium]|nr:50S ribosomal protein L25/general stress protein Ctc [Actinomycetota bacterium]
MAEVRIDAIRRERTGKGAAHRVRASGQVPGIVYGHGMDPLPIALDRREFVVSLQTDAGMNVLLDIQVDGDTTLALMKELQRDPVRGTLLHADFIKVDRDEEVEVDVPVHLVGEPAGVKEGGALEHSLNSLHVRCKATEVPQSIEADISGLNIGDTLRVAELVTALTFTILNDPEAVVAVVAAPVSEEELEAMEAAAGVAVEPEAAEVAAEAAEEEAGTEAGAEGEPSAEPAESAPE